MKTLTLELPDDLDEKEAKTFLAAKLYEKGSLSLGQAAELAGFSKRTFMELLGKYDVSIFNYSAEDLKEEINLLNSIKPQLDKVVNEDKYLLNKLAE
jgi:predicted HTH domain antitoxin